MKSENILTYSTLSNSLYRKLTKTSYNNLVFNAVVLIIKTGKNGVTMEENIEPIWNIIIFIMINHMRSIVVLKLSKGIFSLPTIKNLSRRTRHHRLHLCVKKRHEI